MKLTAEFLKNAFRAYFETLDQCVKGRAYWALLHVLVVLPDVCAAMERTDGDADDGAYRNWCKRFLADKTMTAGDWYRLRCVLLHQGRTRDDEGKSQYEHFRFSHPQGDTPSALHRRIETVSDGRLIHLDVLALSKAVRAAIQKWFEWIEKDAPPETVSYIFKNVRMLAQKSVITETGTGATPFEGTVTYSVTSSHRPTS